MREPRINANVVVGLLREEWARTRDMRRVRRLASKIVDGLTARQVEDIAVGRARLVGTSPGPVMFSCHVEDDDR